MCASIITDRHFLKDNLLCLVSNAVKYADKGATIDVRFSLITAPAPPSQQSSLSLLTTTARPQTMVMVAVEDTGIGISDDLKTVLFRPFQQAQRSAGGTGLGLFALSGRIEALGGQCGVRDRADGKQGSVFWFTFPYRPDESGDPIDEMSEAGGAATNPNPNPHTTPAALCTTALPPLRILLVDDSVSILKVTKRFLEKNGHTVETAENGNQSLERLKARRDDFDLLITDLQMPVMDGYESVRRFRALEQQWQHQDVKRLFIVGMSAKADDETKSDVFEVGMDAFVSKPFDCKTLADELKKSPTFTEIMQRRQLAANGNERRTLLRYEECTSEEV
jgi:CheY-like chemotaxis protein